MARFKNLSRLRSIFRTASTLSAAVFGAVLSAASPLSAQDDASVLRVGIYENNPKVILDPGGPPTGFMPDLIGEIADTLGFTVRYTRCELSDCLEMLESGSVDMVPDIAFSESRAKRFTLSDESVLLSWSHVYMREEHFVEQVHDLEGERLAMVRDSIQLKNLRDAAERDGWQPRIVETGSLTESFRLVRDGKADVAVANRFFGNRNARDYGLTAAQLALWPTPVYFAYNWDVATDRIAEIDTVLSLMKARPDSAYFAASKRWFSGTGLQVPRAWLLAVGVLVVTILIGIVVTHAYLRRRVAYATKALRESERRFKEFAECGSDFFWEMDKDLRFSYFSEKFEEISGFSRAQMLGRTRDKADIPNPDPAALERHLDNMRNHRPFRGFIYPQQRSDGSVIYLSISGQPDFDDKGVFRGYRGTGTDITARREAELARDAALTGAEVASRAKSAFLATMSHEFRTPLNAIIGFSEMLCNMPEDRLKRDRMLDYAQCIHSSGTHMLGLVNDVLDISTIEAGKLELNKEKMDLSTVVERCMAELKGSAEAKRIAVTCDLEAALPLLYADEKKVRQILTNLLSNSLKFTQPDGAVSISARASGNAVSVTVTDNGIGIPPDKLTQVTQPFVKAMSNPMKAEDGTGLGLSIVKSLVEAHGGTLSIENRATGGARIEFELPRDQRMIS